MAFNKLATKSYDVLEDYGDIGDGVKLTYTSWYKSAPKYDLRKWENCKGISLSGEELEGLYGLLKKRSNTVVKTGCKVSNPEKIEEGKKVYIVNMGDVTEYVVNSSFEVKGGKRWNLDLYENDKVYSHEIIWDSDLNKKVFLSYEKAQKIAEEHLSKCDYINPTYIFENAKERKAWKYTRKCDGLTMGCGYCVHDNYIYGFEWYTYQFVIKFKDEKEKNKILKEMKEKREFNSQGVDVTECDFNSDFLIACRKKLKNLYACKEDSNWSYTESGCSHCINHSYNWE